MGRGAGDAVESVFTEVIAPFFTKGLLGADDEGDLGLGPSVRAADEALGEVTGRNLAREAQSKAESRAIQEDVRREEVRERELVLQEQRAREASLAAERVVTPSARSFSRSSGASARSARTTSALGTAEDILGL